MKEKNEEEVITPPKEEPAEEAKREYSPKREVAPEKKEQPKEELPSQPQPKQNVARQIIILTDGNMAQIVKNETFGNLELLAVLTELIAAIRNQK